MKYTILVVIFIAISQRYYLTFIRGVLKMHSITIKQVKEKLKTLNDKTLTNMLNQRKGSNSELTEAIKQEIDLRFQENLKKEIIKKTKVNKKFLAEKFIFIKG